MTPSSWLTARSVANRSPVALSSSPVGSSASSTGGLVGERDRDRDALLLAAGEALRPVVRAVASPTRSSSSRTRRARPRPPTPSSDHRQLDVLARGQVRQQVARGLLPDEADDLAPVQRALARRSSSRSCPATRARPAVGASSPPRMFSSVDLPLPDAPTIAISSPRLDEQVETLERDDLEVGDLVDLDQVVAEDHRFCHQRSPIRSTWSSRARRIRTPATITKTTASAATPTANSTGAEPRYRDRVGTAAGVEGEVEPGLDEVRDRDPEPDPEYQRRDDERREFDRSEQDPLALRSAHRPDEREIAGRERAAISAISASATAAKTAARMIVARKPRLILEASGDAPNACTIAAREWTVASAGTSFLTSSSLAPRT